jgi:hypothetical protein
MQLSAGTGVTILGGTAPISMFKGRFNALYGVNGYGRGFRWDGAKTYVDALGMAKPQQLTAPTASTASQGFVAAVQILDGGAGYFAPPTVTFTGGGATTQAAGVAIIQNGQVAGIRLTNGGVGYVANPTIQFSGGQGTSAAFTVNSIGQVARLVVVNSGTGYTGTPSIVVGGSYGLTGLNAVPIVDLDTGKLTGVDLLYGGTGATSNVTVSLTGGGATTQGSLLPIMSYRVDSVSIAHSGQNYFASPIVTIVPNAADFGSGGALVRAEASTAGNLTSATVLAGGEYKFPPTGRIVNSPAIAVASTQANLKGKYRCAIRYIDDTSVAQGGPIPSSISDLKEVDCGDNGKTSITWTFDHTGADARAVAFELWRTTADQAVALYRVARIDAVAGVLPTTAFVDTLSDRELLEPSRNTTLGGHESKYGFLPIVLPSGQINARRFGVPPTNMAVGCMFQDRAWYSANTDGTKPNSLYFSEIDEPESVHESNELIIQENVADSDAIVALIPFGSMLLIPQRRHTYRLTYVAQPVFDASIQLVAYRGIINSRCWDMFAGGVFIADDYGMYAFDGSQEESISQAVDNYWRDGIIDFSKSANFYVQVNPQDRVVRFYFCKSGDGTYPKRALCFSLVTKAWWEEEYAQEMPCGVVSAINGRQDVIYGNAAGGFLKQSGLVDATSAGTTAVAYQYRTPPLTLVNSKAGPPGQPPSAIDPISRCVSILYTPTTASCPISVGLHYNNSPTARANAVASNRGGGFVTAMNSTAATLDMAATRSSLGDANGKATLYISGRADDRSVGADRHVAIAFSGTQAAQAKIHALTVEGVA